MSDSNDLPFELPATLPYDTDSEESTSTRPWLYVTNAIALDLGQELYTYFIQQTQHLLPRPTRVWNRPGMEPRLTRLYSIYPDHIYQYSGIKHTASHFSEAPILQKKLLPAIYRLISQLEIPVPTPQFDSALVNHYRANSKDKVGAHADRDGCDNLIASINLGAPRYFKITTQRSKPSLGLGSVCTKLPHLPPPERTVAKFIVEPNSVLFMYPEMQREYLHEILQVTDTMKNDNPDMAKARINITLRYQGK